MSYLNKKLQFGQKEESPFLAGRRAGTFNEFEVIPFEGNKEGQKASKQDHRTGPSKGPAQRH
jgi:hypothetical protein